MVKYSMSIVFELYGACIRYLPVAFFIFGNGGWSLDNAIVLIDYVTASGVFQFFYLYDTFRALLV
jgi:hypothetical protein